MKQKPKIYRQGDVLLVKINTRPPNTHKINTNILVKGETTGHAHRLVHGQVLMNNSQEMFIVTTAQSMIVHDEHAPIPLEAGFYQVIKQKEFNPITASNINVLD